MHASTRFNPNFGRHYYYQEQISLLYNIYSCYYYIHNTHQLAKVGIIQLQSDLDVDQMTILPLQICSYSIFLSDIDNVIIYYTNSYIYNDTMLHDGKHTYNVHICNVANTITMQLHEKHKGFIMHIITSINTLANYTHYIRPIIYVDSCPSKFLLAI